MYTPRTNTTGLLTRLGYGGRNGIAAFQRAHGLLVDGVAGPKTRRALDRARQIRFGPLSGAGIETLPTGAAWKRREAASGRSPHMTPAARTLVGAEIGQQAGAYPQARQTLAGRYSAGGLSSSLPGARAGEGGRARSASVFSDVPDGWLSRRIDEIGAVQRRDRNRYWRDKGMQDELQALLDEQSRRGGEGDPLRPVATNRSSTVSMPASMESGALEPSEAGRSDASVAGSEPIGSTEVEYHKLADDVENSADESPKTVLDLTASNWKTIVDRMRYHTMRQSTRGLSLEELIGQFATFDTFLFRRKLVGRRFRIEGIPGEWWGGHVNYIAVGMLMRHHFGLRAYTLMDDAVVGWNGYQVTEKSDAGGMRNLRDILPGTFWALYGAHAFRGK